MFRYIQLPKLKNVLVIAILLRFMDSFMIYTEPFVLTGGGPGNSTTFLSQFLAQIGRFGSFHSDQKPWPFADWPTPRTPEGEAPHVVAPAPHPARDEEPKL